MTNSPKKIAFVASDTEKAQQALTALHKRYVSVAPNDADVIVALGGDGLMLKAMHRYLKNPKPIYGMNRGSIGFLMNEFSEENLLERIESAQVTKVHPLLMKVKDIEGVESRAYAINEVSLFRQTHQTAKLRVLIDDIVRMEELIADGILVSTPAGSTAYNLSANGPILPLSSPLLALTPLTPFRPRRWRGALLSDHATITVEVLEPRSRPVAAVADSKEVRYAARVESRLDKSNSILMLHDGVHGLDERILREQFAW
ncbi:MAG: NAD kinase [Methylobacteriaceae bacterium]|jgi:NAD+ kinase|nr:NAD kinase [Methylobacteriaceae bacterium]